MKPIDVGQLKIAPYELERILELKINKPLNDHSTLYVYGIVKDENEISPVTDSEVSTRITCTNEEQLYFNGILQEVKLTIVDAVYYIEIYAISNTILLDTKRYNRSFQDNDENYQSIVETVISKKEAVVEYHAAEKTVENIILQYNETDWEFAKRLASHTQDVLIPITTDSAIPVFHYGVPDKGDSIIDSADYSITRNYNTYRDMSTEPEPLTESEVTVYTVETDELLGELGEKLTLNGIELHIRHITITLTGAALTVTYTLCDKNGISTPKQYNHAITGLTLDGTVLEVEKDTLKLHLYIDKAEDRDQDAATAHLFKYATNYSAETHTGWYVMPEEGDRVQLYFPTEDEKDAYAASSIRKDDTERTTDPLVKYWRTTFGKEIKMNDKEILITSRDDTTYIRINEDTGIEIITPQPIQVHGGSTLQITSADDMSIATRSNLHIQARNSITMVCGENVMRFVPSTGIAVSTDKNFELQSKEDTILDSSQDLTVKTANNMQMDIGSELSGTAQTNIELKGNTSTIILEGAGIDIKAAKINEN